MSNYITDNRIRLVASLSALGVGLWQTSILIRGIGGWLAAGLGVNLLIQIAITAIWLVASWGLYKRMKWGWYLAVMLGGYQLFVFGDWLQRSIRYGSFNPSFLYTWVISPTLWQIGLAAALSISRIKMVFLNPVEERERKSIQESRFQMWIVSLAMALAFAAIITPFMLSLVYFVGEPVLRSIAPYQINIFKILLNYLVPAILFYAALNYTRIGTYLRAPKGMSWILVPAILLLLLFSVAHVLTSAIPGGGATFVLMQFAPLVVMPAKIMLNIGLIWLFAASISFSGDHEAYSPGHPADKWVLMCLLIIPISYFASFYVGDKAPFYQAIKASALFQDKCKLAGEKIYEHVQNVQSIYLEPDGGRYFDRIVDGVYRGYGSSILGGPLVNSGFLLYFEKQNDRQKIDGSTAKFRRYTLNDWKGEPADELTSDYGVFQKSLVTDEEKNLGLSGTEVTIKNLRDEHVVASLVFFTSSRQRLICGHSGNGRFVVSDFIGKSLNLTQQFPSAFPQRAVKTK